jgi:hypothetical protein
MRWIHLGSLGAVLALAAGCGKESPPQSFEFQTKVKPAQGEPIRFAYALPAGGGFLMKMGIGGSLSITAKKDAQTVPLDMTMEMSFRCDEVRDDGTRVMTMRLGSLGGASLEQAGAKKALAGMQDVRCTMEMDHRGAVKNVKMEGGTAEMRQQVEQMMQQPGGRPFLVYPEEGLRIGEAIDYTRLFSSDQMRLLMGAQGHGIVPEIVGEAVLVRTLQIDGREAAEFALNLVMNMKGTTKANGQQGTMDMGLRLTGSQFVEIATGMPIGTLEMHMEGRGNVGTGDETANMAIDMRVTGRVEPLPDEPPPAPDDVEAR